MPALRPMTTREKGILVITIALALGALIYYGFLGNFIEEYRTTTQEIDVKTRQLEAQNQLLAQGPDTDREFVEVQANLQLSRSDKTPQAIFTEEIAHACGQNTTISPHKVQPVPEANEFAYVVVEVSDLKGDYVRMADLLKAFDTRNWLLLELKLDVPGRASENPILEMDARIAKLVRTQDLERKDQEEINKLREATSSRAARRR